MVFPYEFFSILLHLSFFLSVIFWVLSCSISFQKLLFFLRPVYLLDIYIYIYIFVCMYSYTCTSTRQKIRIFWKIAIAFLTLAQNPFNYSKRFNIILEINEGKLVHNYGSFNYKYMYFLKMHFFENFYLITSKNNKEKTTKLNNKLHPSVSILCCITSSLDDSFNATRHAVYQLLTFMGSYLIATSLDGIFQLFTSIWLMFMQLLFHNLFHNKFSMGFKWGELAGQSNTCTWQFSHHACVDFAECGGARSCWKMNSLSPKSWSAAGTMKYSRISWISW